MVVHVLKMGIMTSCPTPVCWGGGGGGGGQQGGRQFDINIMDNVCPNLAACLSAD